MGLSASAANLGLRNRLQTGFATRPPRFLWLQEACHTHPHRDVLHDKQLKALITRGALRFA